MSGYDDSCFSGSGPYGPLLFEGVKKACCLCGDCLFFGRGGGGFGFLATMLFTDRSGKRMQAMANIIVK
jgi:hypothetical protein